MKKNYLKKICIGKRELSSNVILAPMSGVTDMPFRRLVKEFGAGQVISEMIASEAMIRETRQSLQKACKFPGDTPATVQLAGCDPKVMAEAAKANEDLGADIIDINMGCPVKKVVNGWSGSALMKDEVKAAKILEATVKAVTIPVTLKTRTGWNTENRNSPRLAKIAEESGIQLITIHGRTRCQLYNGKADWKFIRNVKDSVTIPVIGNGDVRCEEDAAQLLDDSGADGVMIGRGCYGRPWFLQQVIYFLEHGQKLAPPSLCEQKNILLRHIQDMFDHYEGETGLKMARKHIGWYSKGLNASAEFRSEINQLMDKKQVLETITNFYEESIRIKDD